MKYLLITGGVMSGIGKGIVASSLGAIFRACDLNVTFIKIDPYLNENAGTLSPYEHGEVFVLDDGSEVDLDFGNYERFLDINLTGSNSITNGKIYMHTFDKARRGVFLGKTIQLIPHITDGTVELIVDAAHKPMMDGRQADLCIIELGGTVGDFEQSHLIESLRQLEEKVGSENFCSCLVSLVPVSWPSKEQKSKPTQSAVKLLRGLNLSIDMIVGRCEVPVSDSFRNKVHDTCGIKAAHVYGMPNLATIYQAPLELSRQGMAQAILNRLGLSINTYDTHLKKWSDFCQVALGSERVVPIALVGKYTRMSDSYLSVTKALQYACYSHGVKPSIKYINSEFLEQPNSPAWNDLRSADCLVVPGGFGYRGVEGMINAIEYARTNELPFLGVCLGFQMAVVEFARNVLKLGGAHSGEFEKELTEAGCEYRPIIKEMLEYVDPTTKHGGKMRCGLRKTILKDGCMFKKMYGDIEVIEERHRHRYEVDLDYVRIIEAGGLEFVGRSEDGTRMQVLEYDQEQHPYFVGTQFHPEYLSRPFNPSPPYKQLIAAALDRGSEL